MTTKARVVASRKRHQSKLAPGVLKWARERAGMEVAELAKKIRVKPERVNEWEKTGQISRRQTENLARSTHTPFGYLFSKKPAHEPLPIADFRTRGGADRMQARPSPGLLSTIYNMQNRQEYLHDYMIDLDIEPPSFVGKFNGKGTIAVADAMHEALGLGPEWASGQATWEKAFSHLIERMDNAGVMAIVSGIVGGDTHHRLDPDEFQGFALVDDHAPLIFVNGADYKAAQMFTAAHELAHIFTGAGGLSSLQQTFPRQDIKTEEQCNRIAAEFLIPTDALRQFLSMGKIMDQMQVARHFKVSNIVAARRMFDVGSIDRNDFGKVYADYIKQHQTRPKKKGGNYWNTAKYRVGRRFGTYIVNAVAEGRVSYTDAYQLTGIGGGTFEKYAKNMFK